MIIPAAYETKVTSPCLQMDPQLQQPLHDELDRRILRVG